MSETRLPLQGETIVFTGSNEPVDAVRKVEEWGGKAMYLPLIETSIRQSDVPDLSKYSWLIFTSRVSASAFCMLNLEVTAKIAAVGEKTAEVLQQHGYTIDFMPSIYSADVFVKEFPEIAGDSLCLFIKGALAKNTIAEMALPVDEWTVYDTILKIDQAEKLKEMKQIIVIFASPSAVSAYRKAGGDWQGIRIAAIGHVTEKAILEAGGHVDYIPEKYTYLQIIKEIAKGSCLHD